MAVCLVNRGTMSQHGSALGNLCSNAVLTLDFTMLPPTISLSFGSIHSSTASNTCAQGRTGIHRHHKYAQRSVGHWQQTQQSFPTTNSLRNMFLLKN